MKKHVGLAGLAAITLVLISHGAMDLQAETVDTDKDPTLIEVGTMNVNDDGTVQTDRTAPYYFAVPTDEAQIPNRALYHDGKEFTDKHLRAEKWLAGMLFGECRGVGASCMYAVGHVAMNRARLDLDRRYGHGLWGVINKNKQFSCFNKSDPNRKVITRAFANKLKPGTSSYEKWELAQNIAHDLMHRATTDPTYGATHYHTPTIRPAWMNDRGMQRTARISGHVFYKWNA